MFALGFYSYELVASSNVWSIFAVEAALKRRLGAEEKTPLRTGCACHPACHSTTRYSGHQEGTGWTTYLT
jgi:hypothetical protein